MKFCIDWEKILGKGAGSSLEDKATWWNDGVEILSEKRKRPRTICTEQKRA